MKRIISVVIMLFLLTASLSGCTANPGGNINERLIVQGVGIDLADDGKIKITVQVLNTEFISPTAGQNGPEQLVSVYKLEGTTVSDALKSISAIAGKLPLYSHNRVVVLGKSLAESGIDKAIDFFTRDSSCRSNLHIAISETTAEEIMTLKTEEGTIPAKEIEDALKSAKYNSDTAEVLIYEVLKMEQEETTSIYIPMLKKSDVFEGDGDRVQVTSTAVFDGCKMVGVLEGNETRGLLWLTDDVRGGSITIENVDNAEATFTFYNTKSRITVSEENDKLVYNVKIKCSVDNAEYNSIGFKTFNEETALTMEKEMEKEIEYYTKVTAEKLLKEYKLDCMRFGRILFIKEKNLYRELSGNWQNELENIEINVSANVTIRRVGQGAVKY